MKKVFYLLFALLSATALTSCEGTEEITPGGEQNQDIKLSISTSSLQYDANGGTQLITISTNAKFAGAESYVEWINFKLNNTQLQVIVQPNPTMEERTSTICISVGETADFLSTQKKQSYVYATVTQKGASSQKDDGTEVYQSDVSIRHWEWGGGDPIEECMKKVGPNLYEYHITGRRAANWPLRDVTRMYFVTPKGLMGVFDVVGDKDGSFYYGNLNPADWFTDSAVKDWKTSEHFTYYDFPDRTNNGTSPYGDASAWYRTTPTTHLVWTDVFQPSITQDVHDGGDAVITVDLNNYTFTYTDGRKAMPAQDHWYVYSRGVWYVDANYQQLSTYNDMKQGGIDSGILVPLASEQDGDYGNYAPQLTFYWWYKGQKYMLENHDVANIKSGYNEYGQEYLYITSPLVPGSHDATLVENPQYAWTDYLQLQNETTLMWPKDKCWRVSTTVYKKNGRWWAVLYTSDTCFKEDVERICR